jgi:hypothetical protein
MQGVNALAEIASSLPDFIGGASRNDDGGQTSSRFFSGEPRRDTRNDDKRVGVCLFFPQRGCFPVRTGFIVAMTIKGRGGSLPVLPHNEFAFPYVRDSSL